eukprot:2444271-Alexandrium_andersonii.AAC.1
MTGFPPSASAEGTADLRSSWDGSAASGIVDAPSLALRCPSSTSCSRPCYEPGRRVPKGTGHFGGHAIV